MLKFVQECEAGHRFRYIVTPNVDIVVRLSKDRSLRSYYESAWLSLCDSKPISVLARALSFELPLVTGSDLTIGIFASIIKENDTITLIAANEALVCTMRQAYPKFRFRCFVPPDGVWNNPEALKECVHFIAGHESRLTFIAIGSPQSEKIAYEVSLNRAATGVGLCVGAGLEFLLNTKKRAPRWMRSIGMEWLYRLTSEPKRLWRRYIYSVLPLLRLIFSEVNLRRKAIKGVSAQR